MPLDDESQDFVFSTSLLTHLLEDDTLNYLRESFRVLKKGHHMSMSTFCLEHIALGTRYTFKHRSGNAYIESEKHPQAAVAYEERYLADTCREIGFSEAQLLAGPSQSVLLCRK